MKCFYCVLYLLFATGVARASDFLDRYDGTTVRFDWTWTYTDTSDHSSDHTSNIVSISKLGLRVPGYQIMRHRRIQVIEHDWGTEKVDVDIRSSGFSWEIRSDSKRNYFHNVTTTTVSLSGGSCRATTVSTISKVTVKCTIITRSSWHAPDDQRACKAVQETVARMKSLLTHVRRQPVWGSGNPSYCHPVDEARKIGSNIRGAGCQSKMGEVEKLLKRAEAGRCMYREPLGSANGVRG
jgi:hypothetical protein